MSIETITLGGGCFWCIEAAFQDIRGVESIASGYAGGTTKNPNYQEICTGTTNHAEVVQVAFDNDEIDVRTIMGVFFALHDPTTLNRQGADIGTQYRSVIFYHSDDQRKAAETMIKQLEADEVWDNPVVTEVRQVPVFYPAESYHQDYYQKNSAQPYCQAVISPKLSKLRAQYSALLK